MALEPMEAAVVAMEVALAQAPRISALHILRRMTGKAVLQQLAWACYTIWHSMYR